jgi:roadblock/LC7 domain-containing protein
MAIRCEVKGCPYFAVEGQKLCLQHKPAAVAMRGKFEEEGYAFVSLYEIPTSARYNEAAGKLLAAVKASQLGHALKVSMAKFKKITLVTAQRYALAGGLRIGVRIVGETGYLWKLNEAEIKAVEQKGDKVRKAREKKGRKAQAA